MSMPIISVAIIDDEKLYRVLLSNLLIRSGLVVMFHAENGRDGIDQLKTLVIPPMVIILDLEMPVMNGFDTAGLIRLNWPEIKIITNSSLMTEDVRELAIKSGADIFLSKAVVALDLIDIINQLLCLDPAPYKNICKFALTMLMNSKGRKPLASYSSVILTINPEHEEKDTQMAKYQDHKNRP